MFLLAWTCFGPRRRAALRATKPNISARDAPESLVSPSHPPTLLVLLPDVPTVLIPATPSLASRLPGPPRCPVCPTAQLPRVPWPASLPPLLPGLLAHRPHAVPVPSPTLRSESSAGWRPLRVRRQAREGAMAHLTTRRAGGRYAGGGGAGGALTNTWHVPHPKQVATPFGGRPAVSGGHGSRRQTTRGGCLIGPRAADDAPGWRSICRRRGGGGRGSSAFGVLFTQLLKPAMCPMPPGCP